MGKTVAIIGGLIILIGLLLGFVIPAMGLWYGALKDPDWLFEVAWNPLGEFIIKNDNTTQNIGPLLVPQVSGYAILLGGVIILLGGLAGSRKFAWVGIIATIFGIALFGLTLQSTLDTPDYYVFTTSVFGFPVGLGFTPYDPDYSIFTTLNQLVTGFFWSGERTQMLGGEYWMAGIGTAISLVGLSGLKK